MLSRKTFIAWAVGCALLLASGVSFGSQRGKNANVPKRAEALEIKDPVNFFKWFMTMKKKVTGKSEFETEEEFKKRRPPPFNSNKIIYFRAEGERILGTEYRYDIKNNLFTAFLEENWDRGITLAEREKKVGQFIGVNVFGTKVLVTEIDYTKYVLNLLNPLELPETLFPPKDRYYDKEFPRRRKGVFITASLEPKKAKRLSRNYEIIVGVRLPGYERSDRKTLGLQATIENPSQPFFETFLIDAYLVKIMLRDGSTGAILKTVDIPQTPAPERRSAKSSSVDIPKAAAGETEGTEGSSIRPMPTWED